jgi:hypothetical protein
VLRETECVSILELVRITEASGIGYDPNWLGAWFTQNAFKINIHESQPPSYLAPRTAATAQSNVHPSA